ncbi:kinase-like protein [Amylocarpus encephaloides]|uniref:EKC/KEOPS complex subunit BUD32 n=1 Tax=Amylocarpus encephaloides TaxID=45428 RepID=A0A9P8C560_9HELO|nr:kinase-like protein [Amylocarpus encephaloides]
MSIDALSPLPLPADQPPDLLHRATSSPLPLPPIFNNDPAPPELITQGAEALLYRTTYLLPSMLCALKYRPSKPYRHPILDARLTKHRILSEARVLVKCRREGVAVPAVYALDEREGWLMIEWVEGEVVRIKLNEWLKRRKEVDAQAERPLLEDPALKDFLGRVGTAVGKMHGIGIVHGDLTSSNLMLRLKEEAVNPADEEESRNAVLKGEVVLIDFGLASQSTADEDRAVDLYVLERAFGSTHPSAEEAFAEVLAAYGKSFKGANIVLKKLEDVRMRGRKRSMLG